MAQFITKQHRPFHAIAITVIKLPTTLLIIIQTMFSVIKGTVRT